MIDTAGTLVPPGSSVIEVVDNSEGLVFEVGDYWATLHIDDGGLAPDALLSTIDELAAGQGWAERYRCDLLDGWKVGYSRDDFKVSIAVFERDEDAEYHASVHIQRLGDGNDWPPRDCSLALASH
jgi:hypothetical protein